MKLLTAPAPRRALLLSRAGCARSALGKANSGQQHLENVSRRAGPGQRSRLHPPPRAAARPKWQRHSATPAAAPGAGPGEPQPMAAGPGRDAAEPRAGVSPPLAWSAVRSPERWGARAGLARRRGRAGRCPPGAARGPLAACPSPAAVPEEQTPGGSVTKSPNGAPTLPTLSHHPAPPSPALSEVHRGPACPHGEPTAPALLLAGAQPPMLQVPGGVWRGPARTAPAPPAGVLAGPYARPAAPPLPPTAGGGARLRLRSRSGGRWGSHGGGPGAGEVRGERHRGERPRERAAWAGPLRRSGPGCASRAARPGQRWAGAGGGRGAAPPGPSAPRCCTGLELRRAVPREPLLRVCGQGAPRGERGLELLLPCLPHWTLGACWCGFGTRLEGFGWFPARQLQIDEMCTW